MTGKFFDFESPASLQSKIGLVPHRLNPLVSPYDLMIVDGISARPTILDLIQGPDHLQLLNQWLILRYGGECGRVMLLVAHDYVAD